MPPPPDAPPAAPARAHGRSRLLLLLLTALGLAALALDVLSVSPLVSPSLFRRPTPPRNVAADAALRLLNATQSPLAIARGVVIPMFEDIALLGLSLVLELRAMGVSLPVEVPHCGDLNASTLAAFEAYKPLGDLRFYDACEIALTSGIFCNDLADCQEKFRGFEVKVLAVALSSFRELALLDADTVFFQDPTRLFDSDKFRTTGTLFFHDRASHEIYWMAGRLNDGSDNTIYHEYMSKFDVAPFRAIPTLDRPKATLDNPVNLPLGFEPSDFLLRSNVWNKLTGHQMDSSLVLWSKQRQPRATAILASFIASKRVGRFPRPPSYGDKEFFFTACELAETQYSFSDFGISGFGTDVTDNGPGNSTLCGTMAQVYPIKPPDATDVRILHANSDFIMTYTPKDAARPLYFARGRPADFYPGPFGDRPMECPFNITAERLTESEEDRIVLRQKLRSDLEQWRDVHQRQQARHEADV